MKVKCRCVSCNDNLVKFKCARVSCKDLPLCPALCCRAWRTQKAHAFVHAKLRDQAPSIQMLTAPARPLATPVIVCQI